MTMIDEQHATHVIANLVTGFWLSRAVQVLAQLGIPDLLRDEPQDLDALARATGAHPRSLYRLLRALAAEGIVEELEGARFAATPCTRVLERDRPGSLASSAIYCGEVAYPAWGELLHNVRTGETALERCFGAGLFEHLARHPAVLDNFNRLVASVAERTNEAVALADLSSARVIVDVGGGHANLLAAIVERIPGARGVLFDLPHVIESARRVIPAHVADRVELVGGSFLESVPAGDTYLLKLVLHDCDDAQAAAILRNIHRHGAGAGRVRVVIIDSVVPDGPGPHASKMWDLNMMIHGGAERTASELARLLSAAGFELSRITPVPSSHLCVVEAVDAGPERGDA